MTSPMTMPKLISRQPAWLSRSTPAHQLFNVKSPDSNEDYQRSGEEIENPGFKILAHRDSEVFVADSNTIRWADLASMKDNWESIQNGTRSSDDNIGSDDAQYRVLELRYVAEPILQIIPSPNKALLAVVTAHTIHICTIPDSKHLSETSDATIRPKTQMLGPTTHVVSASRVVSALWHPLGVAGNCLVTVTEDAVVRVWELSMQNRYTFEEPTIALDLRKLKKATSTKADVRPRPLGISEGISYDYVGMDVASACFGGRGEAEEPGWSGMTLWLAMAEGDVYALCPLLPKKWQAHPALMHNLTSSILAKKDEENSEADEAIFTAQLQWLVEQERELAMETLPQNAFEQPNWIYTQSGGTGSLPKLQGPFSIVPGDLEYELALADIHVVAPLYSAPHQGNTGALLGMPASMVCLLTQSAVVYVCLELEGIHGTWLPKESVNSASTNTVSPELVVLGALDTLGNSEENSPSLATWPMITTDIHSQYDFYVTHYKGIWHVSAAAWVQSLETEMLGESSAGTGFRMGIEAEGNKFRYQQILPLLGHEEEPPSAPLIMNDSDLGYIVLTVHESSPHIAILDNSSVPEDWALNGQSQAKKEISSESSLEGIPDLAPRAAYVPSKVFKQDVGILKEQLRNPTGLNTKINQTVLKEQIRLSPAVLEFMTWDHRVLSEETHKLGLAIADLFTRCHMLQAEFVTEIQRVREIAERVETISEDYDSDTTREPKSATGSKKLESRLHTARDRQASLLRRFEALRQKTASISRPLSDREKSWASEVDRIARDLPEDLDEDEQSSEQNSSSEGVSQATKNAPNKHLRRYLEARDLAQQMCSEAGRVTEDSTTEKDDTTEKSTLSSTKTANFSPSKGLRVPADVRRQKMALLQGLLERESALVDAVTERLDRLRVQV